MRCNFHPVKPLPMRFRSGFTLIELMVAVAIVAILVSIALPSYTQYIERAKRADAQTQLLQVAQFMQRFYAANDSFKQDRADPPNLVLTQIPANLKQSPADGDAIYELKIETVSAFGYELRMVPVGIGSMGNDDCGAFTLTSTGVRGVFVGGAVGNTALRNTCWK